MAGYLIKDTTKEEREQIVAESLGYMEANCDGCTSGLAEMYQAYIDGRRSFGTSTWNFMQVMYPERKCPAAGLVPCNNSVRERWISGINKMLSAKTLSNRMRKAGKRNADERRSWNYNKTGNGQGLSGICLPEKE